MCVMAGARRTQLSLLSDASSSAPSASLRHLVVPANDTFYPQVEWDKHVQVCLYFPASQRRRTSASIAVHPAVYRRRDS